MPTDYHGRFRASLTVLENQDHGPQLCAAVAESFPPQCSGPDIKGWHWSDVKAQSANGTTWGTYTVTGRFAAGVFTLTKPAAPAHRSSSHSFPASLCPRPPGGWNPPEPGRATPAAKNRVVRAAHAAPGYAGFSIGWLVPESQITESDATNPRRFVINVLTTGDTKALEARLRRIWGGNLCVAAAQHTEHELNRVARSVSKLPGVTAVGVDTVTNTVSVTAWVATEKLWRRIVREYGANIIRLDSLLHPID